MPLPAGRYGEIFEVFAGEKAFTFSSRRRDLREARTKKQDWLPQIFGDVSGETHIGVNLLSDSESAP